MNPSFVLNVFRGNTKDAATPETSHGGPVYDAAIDPAYAGEESITALRLQAQRDLHLFYDKSAAAQSFSHYSESYPSPITIEMMGLARQRDVIETQVSRKYDLPFPGVELGHLPSVSSSWNVDPVLGGHQHLTHHAHQVESKRATRARFGR